MKIHINVLVLEILEEYSILNEMRSKMVKEMSNMLSKERSEYMDHVEKLRSINERMKMLDSTRQWLQERVFLNDAGTTSMRDVFEETGLQIHKELYRS